MEDLIIILLELIFVPPLLLLSPMLEDLFMSKNQYKAAHPYEFEEKTTKK